MGDKSIRNKEKKKPKADKTTKVSITPTTTIKKPE